MGSSVRKWGNGLGVRIPKAVAEQVAMREGSPIEVIAGEGGVIIIQPRSRARGRKRETLRQLLTRAKPQHRHGELDKSGPVGRELI